MLDSMKRTWLRWTVAYEGLLAVIPLVVVVMTLVSAPQPQSVIAGQWTSNAAQAGAIHVEPASAAIEVGDTVTVDVVLSDGAGYYGLELELAFDAGVVAVPSAEVEPVWEVFDAAHHWTVRNEVDNASGTVHYAVTNLRPAEPFTGTGRVCSITFTGVDPGRTALEVIRAEGSTRDGEPLHPATMDGEIVVAGAPAPPGGSPVGGATLVTDPLRDVAALAGGAMAVLILTALAIVHRRIRISR